MIVLLAYVLGVGWSFAVTVVALRAAARARAARCDLLTLVRILDHRLAEAGEEFAHGVTGTGVQFQVQRLQSDLRATFVEFFTDQERAR